MGNYPKSRFRGTSLGQLENGLSEADPQLMQAAIVGSFGLTAPLADLCEGTTQESGEPND